jgi:GMP synthase (glutamine-hydrolysing)
MKVLLLQARDPGDPMLVHEVQSIQARLHPRPITLITRNAVAEPASPAWLSGMGAVIIGGSGDYSVHHQHSQAWVGGMLKLIGAAIRDAVPGFAICFGHQLLATYFGAQVITDHSRAEVGTLPLHLTEEGRNSTLFRGFPTPFLVQTGHTDHVMSVPNELTLLVTNKNSPQQAFQVRKQHFYSTQFHPDLSGAEAQSRYLTNKKDSGGQHALEILKSAQQYQIGADITNSLLGRFIDEICTF